MQTPNSPTSSVRGLAKGWPAQQLPRLDDKVEQDLDRLVARLSPERRGQRHQARHAVEKQEVRKVRCGSGPNAAGPLEGREPSRQGTHRRSAERIGNRANDRATMEIVLGVITPRTPPELAAGLLEALRESEAADTGKLILERLPGLRQQHARPAWPSCSSRPDWTQALLDGADKGTVQLTELSLDQRQALAQHPDRRIRRARRGAARDAAGPAQPRPAEGHRRVPAHHEGQGRCRQPASLCSRITAAKCHVHTGEGTHIGPDLTGMAVHPKEHLLVDILDPSRSVEGELPLLHGDDQVWPGASPACSPPSRRPRSSCSTPRARSRRSCAKTSRS